MVDVRKRAGRIWMLCAAAVMLLAQCTPETLKDFTINEGTVDVGPQDDAGSPIDAGDLPLDIAADVPPPACEAGVKPCPEHSNPCRDYTCSAGGQCVEDKLKDGAFCEDGDPCTDDSSCIGGECLGGDDKDCDDDNPCTADVCDTSTGKCSHDSAKNGTKCEPAQAECWNTGQCIEGACQGKTPLCKCHPEWQSDDSPDTPKCAEWVTDGDKCDGKNFCKKLANGYACAANPATVVECGDKKDTQCLVNKCDAETGTCAMVQVKAAKEGDFVLCNDGDECTNAEKCIDGQCKITDIATQLICKCTPKYLDKCLNELGTDPCDGVPYCDQYPPVGNLKPMCKLASKVECSTTDDTACLKRLCDEKTGDCVMTKVEPIASGGTVLCDDGDPCTPNDVCTEGLCTGGSPNLCPCQKDADCADKDDGDLCNGTFYCDQSGGTKDCKINPASVVNCATANDTVCVRNFCFPKTGKCAMTPTKNLKTIILTIKKDNKDVTVIKQKPYPYAVNEFVSCDDGSDCTVNDECIGASCQPGKTNTCKCSKDADCSASDDGDLCNGTLYCEKATGECVPNPSSLVTCSKTDNTQCLANLCDPKKGACALTPILEGKICQDGNACTANDECVKGVCTPGETYLCKCAKNADCDKDEDGDMCNGTLYCDKAKGFCHVNPATLVKCSDSNDSQCEKNVCDKKTGICKVTAVNDNVLCDDGDPCTPSPVCQGGKCYDETNICQCKADADCAPFEDGNACTGKLFCDKNDGMCKTNPATVVACAKSKNTACSKNSCDAADGKCKQVPVQDNVILCDDGNPCSQFDKCVAGKCESGTNTCQCVEDLDCAVIDDSDKCDGTLFCDKSNPTAARCVPKPNSKVTCKPDDPASCIAEVCNTQTGKCEMTDKGDCDDKDPCTLDGCALSGADEGKCKNTPAPDGAGAGVNQVCVGGKVVAVPANMSLVPAGEFYMGCNGALENCAAFPKDSQHKVKISAFWMDRYEVTTALYQACIDAAKCAKPTLSDPGCNLGTAGRQSHPMNCLSQAQAKAFCTWDGGKRLPTAAEWEKSARGGCLLYGDDAACKAQTPTYVWADASAPDCDQAIMNKDGVGDGCGDDSTSGVASRAQTDLSPYGIYDLAGNAKEYVADFWDEDFYSKAGATADDAENKAASSDIVIRGGGWKSKAVELRAAHRGHVLATTDGAVDVGFRCGLTLK